MEDKQKEKNKHSKEVTTILGRVGIFLIGIYLLFLAVFLIYLFVAFWPTAPVETSSPQTEQAANIVDSGNPRSEALTAPLDSQPGISNKGKETESLSDVDQSKGKTSESKDGSIFWFEHGISHEVRIILLVIIAGALGSFVHVVTSFVDFVGAKKFKGSWTWWYFLRPFSGSVLALIFYLIIRGGLLSTQIEGTDLSHFGVTGMAGLIGLFSKQAINKLSEMFDIIFMRKEKVELPDSLEKENNQGSDEEKPLSKK